MIVRFSVKYRMGDRFIRRAIGDRRREQIARPWPYAGRSILRSPVSGPRSVYPNGGGQESMKREFYVIVERDEDGYYVGEVPQLRGCYAQGRTLDELMRNIREVIQLALEDETTLPTEPWPEFIGVQKVVLE